MKKNLLSNVNVYALSIVEKGANNKRFYLRKAADDGLSDADLVTLPAPHRLIKAEGEWEGVVYCVVAEPGWEEQAGQGADNSVTDVWASADEIRKAAHRFMGNGHLVNKMHESLEPYGELVENFIAQTTYTMNNEIIKAGSWVVGVKLSDDGKQAVDKGEFTGVSIQGDGVRTLVEKAGAVAGRPHTGNKRFGGKGIGPRTKQAQRLKAAGKTDAEVADAMGTDTKTVASLLSAAKTKPMAKVLARIGKAVGVDEDELLALAAADEIAKGSPTFDELIAQREMDDELPAAFDALREVVWRAFVDDDDDPNAPGAAQVITDSLAQFQAWALDLLGRIPVAKQTEMAEQVQAMDAATLGGDTPSEEDDVDKTELEKTVKEQGEQIAKLETGIDTLLERTKPEEAAPSVADLKKGLDEAVENIAKLAQGVNALAEGGSTIEDDDEGGRKTVAKSNDPLAGLLG